MFGVSAGPALPRSVALRASKSAAAKKKGKKKASGGGFGSSPSPRGNKQAKSRGGGDSGGIVYPDLEPQVLQTLVPSPIDGADEGSSGVLSEEMYDRLEEIYGFKKFNFGGANAIYTRIGTAGQANEEQNDAFDDIISVGGSAASQSDSILDGLFSSPGDSSSSSSISLDDIIGPSASAESKTSSTQAAYDLNGIPPFQKFRVLHTDPMVLAIDDFFTAEECDEYVQMSQDSEQSDEKPSTENLQPMLLGQSQTVGKDSRSKAQRTSTTWFHYYEGVPQLMAKASRLLGIEAIERFEEPQTVRYRRNEKFTWHLDALSPEEANNESGAGQRVATLLVYLTDLPSSDGGATMFRDLGGGDSPLKV